MTDNRPDYETLVERSLTLREAESIVPDGQGIVNDIPGRWGRIPMHVVLDEDYQKAKAKGEQVKPEMPTEGEAPNVISSLLYNGMHAPVLDIDIPATLVPSSTEGHSHLYLDVAMTWTQYCKLLDLLSEVGIIEEGYRNASIARGFTAARLPWVKKNNEPAKGIGGY